MEQSGEKVNPDLENFLSGAEKDYTNSRREAISDVQNLEDLISFLELFGNFKNNKGEIRSGVEQASLIGDLTQLIKDKKIDVNNNDTLNMYLKPITTALGIRTKVEELVKKI